MMLIRFPSNLGISSGLPTSSSPLAKFNNSISPLSLNTMVLPTKCTYALTLAPSLRKLTACFNLKLKSCSSVLGPKRISLMTVLVAFALIYFCFFF